MPPVEALLPALGTERLDNGQGTAVLGAGW